MAKKLDVTTGKAVNYEYDTLGRLIYSWQTGGDTLLQKTAHLYDTENRITSQSWQLGTTSYSESYSYNSDDGSLATMNPAVGSQITFAYDSLKRLQSRTNGIYAQSYGYRDIVTNGRTTTQVESLSYAKVGSSSLSGLSFTYAYDNVGNISSVNAGSGTYGAKYSYDQLGQLTAEENAYGKYTYVYDTAGNLLSVKNTTTGATLHSYTYGDDNWRDKLTAFDNQSITYDAIGNPTSYYNGIRWSFGWSNGRQLTSASGNGKTITYTYDVAGIRDSKTVNGTTYSYLTQNGQVVRQSGGGKTLDFIYDNQGRPYALVYNGTTYYYILNLQGDVVRIVNSSGATVADYVYDAWGALLNTSSYTDTNSIYHINPIRYRGYYYDTETGLYYLQSRYYDPVVKRFINADGFASTGQGFTGCNMFAYCLNQPIMYLDADGKSCDKFKQFLQDAYESGKDCVNAVGTLAKEVFGFKQSIVSTTATQQMGVAEPEPSILCPIVYATGANTTTTLASSGNASKPIVLCTQTEYGSPQKTSISLKLTLGDTVVAFGIGSGTYSASFSRAEGGTTSTTSVGYSPLGKTMLSISQSFTRPVSSQTNATQYNKLKVGWWTIAWGYAFVKSGGKVPISGFSPAIS